MDVHVDGKGGFTLLHSGSLMSFDKAAMCVVKSIIYLMARPCVVYALSVYAVTLHALRLPSCIIDVPHRSAYASVPDRGVAR